MPITILTTLSLLLLASCRDAPPQALDLDDNPVVPFESDATATVLIFIQTDCPTSNRYAPTIARLHDHFAPQGTTFWFVYPDRNEAPDAIRRHRQEYNLKGQVARDIHHTLVKRVGATVTPEAVVFGSRGNIIYRGRIDDRYTALDQARPQATQHDLALALAAALAGRTPDNSDARAIGCNIASLQ